MGVSTDPVVNLNSATDVVARTMTQHHSMCGGKLQGTFAVDFPAHFEDI
jgi:hypothetical protein